MWPVKVAFGEAQEIEAQYDPAVRNGSVNGSVTVPFEQPPPLPLVPETSPQFDHSVFAVTDVTLKVAPVMPFIPVDDGVNTSGGDAT